MHELPTIPAPQPTSARDKLEHERSWLTWHIYWLEQDLKKTPDPLAEAQRQAFLLALDAINRRLEPMLDVRSNPYSASAKHDPHKAWWDTFAKDGKLVHLVFLGDRLLAQVQNPTQAENLVEVINGE